MSAVECDALLRSYKHKAASQFQQEFFYLGDQCFFEVAFKHWFIFRHTQKFKYIRVFYYINGSCHFNPLFGEG